MLEPIVDELLLADATQCRALAGRRIKTDRDDAANVAELLAAGRLPVAYAPPAHIAELRHWTRHRHHLSQQHARVLHRVKSLMNLCNRPGPARLKAPGLIRYLKAQRPRLNAAIVMQLEMAIDELVLFERQLDIITIKLKALLQQKVFVTDATRLMSFPGVGIVIAATVLAEVGDFARFIHRNAIARYAGFNPSVYASGESCRTGHIAKAGSRDLRWAMVQAAWVAIRSDPVIKKLWLKLKRRSDGKRAAIAIARRMLRWMWHTSKNRQRYQRVMTDRKSVV